MGANQRQKVANEVSHYPPFVVDALVQHRAFQDEARLKAGAKWQELGLVFPNTQGGYFRRPKLHAMYKKLLKEADLPDIRFHDLRHSAATIFLSMGVQVGFFCMREEPGTTIMCARSSLYNRACAIQKWQSLGR